MGSGNTSLQPEESLSRDFGIRYAMASLPVEVDIGYFDIDTDDRIFFDGPPVLHWQLSKRYWHQ